MISPQDIATALGRPLPYGDQADQWATFIADVRLRLRLTFGDLSLLDSEIVDYVTREAVVAMVISQDEENPVPSVFVRSDLMDLLRPSTATGGGAFSFRPTFELMDGTVSP